MEPCTDCILNEVTEIVWFRNAELELTGCKEHVTEAKAVLLEYIKKEISQKC